MAQDPWAQFPDADPAPAPRPQAPQPVIVRRVNDPAKDAMAEVRANNAEARANADQEMQRRNFELNQQRLKLDIATKDKPTATEIELRAKQEGAVKRRDTVNAMLGEVKRLYQQDIQGQPISRLFGATEYIDALPANERFSTASNAILPLIRPLVAQSAKEGDSDKEMQVFMAYVPNANDSDQAIEQKFKMLEMLIGGMVDGKTPSQSLSEMQQGAAAGAPPAMGGGNNPPPDGGVNDPQAPQGGPTPPPFSPGDPQMQANTSGYRQEDDPALVQAGVRDAYAAMLRQGVAPGEGVQALRRLGVTDPRVLKDAAAQLAHRQKNPNFPIDQYRYDAVDDRAVPLSALETGVNAIMGNEYTAPIGAAVIGAGQFLSGNTLDNIGGEQARINLDLARLQNPNAMAVGEVAGGVLGSIGGEALLGRAGMAPGLVRSLLADAGMGAATGAGAADGPDQSRIGNALLGAGVGAAGSVVGNAMARGAARVVSPRGTGMNELYSAGVTPTIGQRFADRGVVGRTINTLEQKAQSIPIVGDAISSARQEARDQFQIGAFNEALKEVGEQLPKGMRPGTDPHAYAQKTFDRVYAEARKGMIYRADEEMAQELQALAPDIATLGPQAQAKLSSILKNQVTNRVSETGEMSGEAYKRTVSDLGTHIARMQKSSNSEDQALADILIGVRGAIDNAARRHSDPEAVALLDAADAGYAKLVRIEDAARRRGGDAGTFSPAQFDSAVQNTSGGVRSKAYLRGDAKMQDFAQQGRSLEDTVPNSGTVDRAIVGGLAGVAGYLEPSTLALMTALGAVYAPGTRKVMQGAIRPGGEKSKAIAAQLRKRAALVGKTTAATGAAYLPGTAPAP